jgi:hypothetical protein
MEVEETLTQLSQRCPWCNDYLLLGQDTNVYNGDDARFIGWIAHTNCNVVTREYAATPIINYDNDEDEYELGDADHKLEYESEDAD